MRGVFHDGAVERDGGAGAERPLGEDEGIPGPHALADGVAAGTVDGWGVADQFVEEGFRAEEVDARVPEGSAGREELTGGGGVGFLYEPLHLPHYSVSRREEVAESGLGASGRHAEGDEAARPGGRFSRFHRSPEGFGVEGMVGGQEEQEFVGAGGEGGQRRRRAGVAGEGFQEEQFRRPADFGQLRPRERFVARGEDGAQRPVGRGEDAQRRALEERAAAAGGEEGLGPFGRGERAQPAPAAARQKDRDDHGFPRHSRPRCVADSSRTRVW